MKKLFILLLCSIFLVTGCYDNVELNKLAIISGIGIDYQDNNFILTYEILNDNKSDNTGDLMSDTITGIGSTISEAFTNASNKTSKKDFFAHLKLVILSESLIQNHLKEITDYLIRDTDIRDEFYLIVANNTTPEKILKHVDKKHPVASEYIIKLINNEKYNNSLPTKEVYQKTLSKLVSKKTDIVLNSISIIDDIFSLNNSYMFNGYNFNSILSLKDSSLYTLLNFNNNGIEYKKYYNEQVFAINICNVKNEINVNNDRIIINTKLEARIIENNANLDLKEPDTYNKVSKEFTNIIKEDITNFIKMLQNNSCDVLGFSDKYYKTYNKDNNNLWKSADINVNVDLKINYKGFVFEVN